MFGMNGVMTAGFILLIIGLVILLVQYLQRRGDVRAQGVPDPATPAEKIIKLIKEYGIGLVLVAFGLLVIVIGALQGDGDDDDDDGEEGTPVAIHLMDTRLE